MIRNLKENTFISIIFLGCLQPFVSPELFSIFGYLYIIVLVINNHFKVSICKNSSIKVLFLIFLIGLVVGILNIYSRAYLRDLYYFLNPIVFLLIGLNITDNYNSYKRLLNSIVAISIIVSLISMAQMIIGVGVFGQLASLRAYFDNVIWGNVFSIGIILAMWDEKTLFEKHKKLCFSFLLLVSFLGLSRTVWIEVIVIITVVLMADKNKAKSIAKLLMISSLAILLVVISLQFIPEAQLNLILDKIGNTSSEISSEDRWTSVSVIQNNWRGYEMYCAESQFKNGSLLEQLLGGGFGTGIKVGRVAALVGQPGEYIYVIHNGFYGMLVKEGIIGVILYICFYLLLIKDSLKRIFRTKHKEVRYSMYNSDSFFFCCTND